LWPHMTVSTNVSYGLKLRKVSPSEVAARTAAVLEKVKLGGLGERYPGQLSDGQQQRMALARALVLNPQILLLDEPLSNLDAKIRMQVRAEIRKLQKELGITTIYVTHDQEEALTLSDRIAVFNQGRILQVGPPKALYERPANRFVADFIGINNFIEGKVLAADEAARRLRAESAFGELAAIYDAPLKAGDRCLLCVRPENIALEGQPGGGVNRVSGKISFAAYLGHPLRHDVDLGHGIVFKTDIRDPWHHDPVMMGASVTLSCPVTSTLAIPVD